MKTMFQIELLLCKSVIWTIGKKEKTTGLLFENTKAEEI